MRLAIDTATDVASVAVGPSHITARSMRGARQHAAQIVLLIRQALDSANTSIEAITEIVVGDGPGSFTGLRIGWAAAKGLAHERQVPLIAVPSLMGFAHAAGRTEGEPVTACFDALRGQVFGAVYRFHHKRVETEVAPGLFTIAELARVSPVRPVLAVGDGAERYAEDVVRWTGRPPQGPDEGSPVAGSLHLLASLEGARRPIDDAATAEPLYGRPAEAQAKWEAHHGRPLPHSSR